MKPQRLLLSILVTFTLVYHVSSQGGYSSSQGGYSSSSSQGYSYPVPNRPLLYPGENEVVPTQDSYRRGRSRVTYGTPEDNVNSDLILERDRTPGGNRETVRERTSTRTETSRRGGGTGGGRVVEEEVIIRRDPSPTPAERVVERVVEEQVVSRGSQRGSTSSSSSYSSGGPTVRRRIVYVDPPAATVVRRRIIYRRRNGGGNSSSSSSYVVGSGGGGGSSSTVTRTIHNSYGQGGGSYSGGSSSSDHSSSSSSSTGRQRIVGNGGSGQTIRRRVYYTTVPSGISGSRVIERTRYIDRSRNSISDAEYVDKPLYTTGSYRTRYRYVTRGGCGADRESIGSSSSCGGESITSRRIIGGGSGGNTRTSTRTIVNNRQGLGESDEKQEQYDDYDDEPQPPRRQNYGRSQNSVGSGYTPGAGGYSVVPQQQYVVQASPPAYVPPQVVSSPPAYQYYPQQYVPSQTTYVAPSQPSYIPQPTYIPQTVVTVPSQPAYVPQQVVQQYPQQQGYQSAVAYPQQPQNYGGVYVPSVGGNSGGGFVQNAGGGFSGNVGYMPNGPGNPGGFVPGNGGTVNGFGGPTTGGNGFVSGNRGGQGNGFQNANEGRGNGAGGRRGGGGRGNGSGTGRGGGARQGRSFSEDKQDMRSSASINHPTYAFPGQGAGSGGAQREVVEEVIYDERERDAGVTREEVLNSGGNVENIQDVRDRVNNEIVREEVIEERQRFVEGEGDNGGGAIEERFVENGDGGLSESGASSTFTRRRTSFRDDRNNQNDRTRVSGRAGGSSTRYSSTNVRERVSNTIPAERVIQRTITRESSRGSASTNRDIANKAYGIGVGNDESISGSSTRRKLLETSFRKDVKAPSYGNVPDEENFNVRSNTANDVNNFRSASTRTSSSSSSQGSGSSRSYSSSGDDDGQGGNVIIRKTTTRILESSNPASSIENDKAISSAQVIEGGTFAASNKDQVINRGGRTSSSTRTSSSRSSSSSSGGGRASYGSLDDDSDGSGSTQSFRVSSFTNKGSALGGRGERIASSSSFRDRREHDSGSSHHFGDSHSAASNAQHRTLPSNYRQLMTGTPDEVAAMTGATYMYTRAAPVCPSGGCSPVASLRGGSEFRAPTSPSLFPGFRRQLNLEHL